MRVRRVLLIILELWYAPQLMAEYLRGETEHSKHRREEELYVSNDITDVGYNNTRYRLFRPDARIVGGSYASNLNIDTSYVVSLQDRNRNHYCGATLITRDCILTAAHCSNKATGKGPITAVVGRNKLSDTTKGERKQIGIEFVHPNYDLTLVGVQWKYDFAVMCFRQPVALSNTILPLNKIATAPRTTSLVQVFGWGDTNKDANIREVSDELKVAKLRVVASTTCDTNYQAYARNRESKVITDDMMCAMHRLQDSCQGDSGGPLVFSGKIVGITSWGVECNNRNFPGVYARISSGYEWIQKKVCVYSKYKYDFNCEEIIW
jgi:trypsin